MRRGDLDAGKATNRTQPSYGEIVRLLMPGAAACDALLESARPMNPTQYSSNLVVNSVVPEEGQLRSEFSFYLESIAFSTYEIDGEVTFGMRFDSPIFGGQVRDLLLRWAISRGWAEEGSAYSELGPYLDYRALLSVLEKSVRYALATEGFSEGQIGEKIKRIAGGGRLAPANYSFDVTVELLADLCDLTFPYRSAGWLRIFDAFRSSANFRSVGREMAYLIADCFEGVADEISPEYWRMLVELTGANGCKVKFADAVVMLAGSVGL